MLMLMLMYLILEDALREFCTHQTDTPATRVAFQSDYLVGRLDDVVKQRYPVLGVLGGGLAGSRTQVAERLAGDVYRTPNSDTRFTVCADNGTVIINTACTCELWCRLLR